MFIDNYLKTYIRDQWVNYRKALNEPQAREELLVAATLHFYERGTSIVKNIYQHADCEIIACNPQIADANGEFQPIFLEIMGEDSYRVELRRHNGECLISCDTNKDFKIQ